MFEEVWSWKKKELTQEEIDTIPEYQGYKVGDIVGVAVKELVEIITNNE